MSALAAIFLVMVVFMGGIALAAVLLFRRAARAVRAHPGVVALNEAVAWMRPPAPVGGRTPTPAELTAMPAKRLRRDLWRAIDRAGSAVRAADECGAPVAGLPSLCRQLSATAIELDRVLQVDPSTPATLATATQAADLMARADEISRSALSAAEEANAQRVAYLGETTTSEIGLHTHGRDAARTMLTVVPTTPTGPPAGTAAVLGPGGEWVSEQ